MSSNSEAIYVIVKDHGENYRKLRSIIVCHFLCNRLWDKDLFSIPGDGEVLAIKVKTGLSLGSFVKGGLTQFWELFKLILSAPATSRIL